MAATKKKNMQKLLEEFTDRARKQEEELQELEREVFKSQAKSNKKAEMPSKANKPTK